MPIVSDTHKFIYIHIPKTGGTTVSFPLRKYRSPKYNHLLEHCDNCDIQNAIGKDEWNNYYKWCTIRNPYALMVSLFEHKKKSIYYFKDYTFVKFIEAIEENNGLPSAKGTITDRWIVHGQTYFTHKDDE